ncbi:MAG: modulator of FtsH protease, partial [Myxococcota bacterium]
GFIGNMVVWGAWVAMAAVVQKVQFTPVTNVVAFSAYALFTGVIVSSIVLVALIMGEQIAGNAMLYVAQAFGITAGVFGGLSIYAYTTKTDFSWMRGVLFVGVIALIILSIVNFFVQSSIFTMAVSFLGVLIFSGYTLYDTQKIMREYPANAHIAAAMALFTNFIMLFMYILRLILMLAGGGNRD